MRMAKGWKEIGNNGIYNPNVLTKEDYVEYKKRMFKVGLAVDRMKTNKPKWKKVKKTEENEVE